MPPISVKPVKCLAKFFDDSSEDKQNVNGTGKQLKNWMDKKQFTKKIRYTKLRHGYTRTAFLLELFGLFLCTSCHRHQLNSNERCVSGYPRKWLAVPRRVSSWFVLHGLPLTSIIEEFKVTYAVSYVACQQ